jgi:hypothetical protein
MTAQRLIEIGHALYGKRGWQIAMAAALGRDTSTIRRWIYADRVPQLAAAALETSLLKQKQRRRP